MFVIEIALEAPSFNENDTIPPGGAVHEKFKNVVMFIIFQRKEAF